MMKKFLYFSAYLIILSLFFLGTSFLNNTYAQELTMDPSPLSAIYAGKDVQITINCPDGTETFSVVVVPDITEDEMKEWADEHPGQDFILDGSVDDKPYAENSYIAQFQGDTPRQKIGGVCYPSELEIAFMPFEVNELPDECGDIEEGDEEALAACLEENSSIPAEVELPPPPPPPCADENIGSEGCTTVNTAIGQISVRPTQFVTAILGILLSISGGIAVLIISFSGYKLMTSNGNPEAVQEARERLTSAIVGLLFIIFSLVIIQVIGVDVLRIPGFGS